MELMQNILKFFLEKEDITKPYKYYTRNPSDYNNMTEFEKLSSNNVLVLKSTLDPIYCQLIITILDSLYENDYNYFTGTNGNFFFVDDEGDEPFNFKDYQNMDLFNQNNYRQFILAYLFYDKNNRVQSGIDNVFIHDIQPQVRNNLQQKVFEIQDIINYKSGDQLKINGKNDVDIL